MSGDGTDAGPSLLVAFRDRLTPAELRATVASFGEDRASTALHAVTGGLPDLAIASHRRALLSWLRAWGCRHLRVADTPRSSAALARWWTRWSGVLPSTDASLVEFGDEQLRAAAPVYSALAALRAATRAATRGDVPVTFGDTAASKALHALRPRVFPPWDEPIRRAFAGGRHDGPAYVGYMRGSADALRGMAARLGISVDDLASMAGRPSSTPARLIDEFLWLRVTSGRRGSAVTA